jgi:hypothetical protein
MWLLLLQGAMLSRGEATRCCCAVPLAGRAGRSVVVLRGVESGRAGQAMADRQLVHRRGVLQRAEQPAAGQAVRTEVLVEFCRALIRNHPSSDVLVLSLVAAQHATKATDDEMALLALAVLGEQQQAPWPEGFFG